MKKLRFKLGPFNVGVVIMLISFNSYSQAIARQSISSYGTTSSNYGHYYQQTVGQAYNTQSIENISVTQGFLQPVNLKIEKVVQKNVEALEINVFPNPSQYSITLQSTDMLKEAVIVISNVQGNIIYKQNIQNVREHIINCSTWATGMYLLKVQNNNNKQFVSKLIVSK